MALKLNIDKAAFDKLTDDVKNEYKKDGEGYTLDVTDMPETGALSRALARLKTDHEDLKEENKLLATENTSLKATRTDKDKDVDRLERKFEREKATLVETHEAEKKKLTGHIDESYRLAEAGRIAAEISTAPALMTDKIAARMAVDLTGDKPKVVYLKADGTPDPALDAKKLGAEFVANPDYKAIIVANRSRGGQAPLSPVAPANGGAPATSDLTKMDSKTLVEAIRSKAEAGGATA